MRDGTLWIGTFGGGLNALRDGKFFHYGGARRAAERQRRQGLRRRRIAVAEHDARHLPHRQKQLLEFQRRRSEPASSRKTTAWKTGCAARSARPAIPTAAAESAPRTDASGSPPAAAWRCSIRMRAKPVALPPAVHLVEMTVNGDPVDLPPARLAPKQRTHADPLHGHSPERAGAGAVLLPAGRTGYRLGAAGGAARDQLQQPAARTLSICGAGGIARRASAASSPTTSRCCRSSRRRRGSGRSCVAALLAAAWAIYQLRLRQIRSRFALVLEERARLAREIHDTLAQGFVGISSQLDAVAMCMPEEATPARSLIWTWRGAWRGTA